jgi:hypothetical protein
LASLLATLERGRWESPAATFERMDRQRAHLPEALEMMLGALAGQLRAARLAEAVRAPVPR